DGELAQQGGLLLLHSGGHHDLDVHVQVTATRAVQVADPEPAQRVHVAGLRPRTQVDLVRPVEGVDLEHGAQGRGRHGDLECPVQVVAAPHERLVRPLANLEVDV